MRNLRKINSTTSSVGLIVLIPLAIFIVSYFLQLSLVLPLFLLACAVYLRFSYKQIPHLFLYLGFLLTLLTFTAYSIVNCSSIPYYYIPTAAAAMLAALLFNDRGLVFLVSVISSLLVGIIAGNNFHLSMVFMLGSLTAGGVVFGARRRAQIIEAGFLGGLIQFITPVLLSPSKEFLMYPRFFTAYALPLIGNGIICAGIVAITLPIFEYLFKVLTNISLLELADFNHPILKRMIADAPGTYHHSLMVGNLAEAAANSIDANSLLARVGSYYHDIGKIGKAEYFSENQADSDSKHDKLQTTMSKMIILNHVKEGEELAKKFSLSPLLIDFISQHHGTSLTHYFYWKALEGLDAQKKDIEEGGFRYLGPKPQKREIAIVLLADSVEAATRTLKEPTQARIEELVRKVINNKFIDGQLDECELTLVDLEKIASTFVKVLSAIYHSRVAYPDRNHENNHHQSSEKNHKSETVQKAGPANPGA
jgi:cyclic-di-AMP phosphodiesterase PgpH